MIEVSVALAEVVVHAQLRAEDLAVHEGRLGLRRLPRIAAAARDDGVVTEAGAGLAWPRAPERTGEVRRREFALVLRVRAGGFVGIDAGLRLAVGFQVTDDCLHVGCVAGLPGERAAQRIVIVATDDPDTPGTMDSIQPSS